MDNERFKAIKGILKESDRLLDLGDIEGHKEKLDELSMHGHLRYMIDTITDQQATIDSLSMAHDAIYREMPKDKHTLIKNIIGLNKRVQELEEFKKKAEELHKYTHINAKKSVEEKERLEQQNKRYREIMEKSKKAIQANLQRWNYKDEEKR